MSGLYWHKKCLRLLLPANNEHHFSNELFVHFLEAFSFINFDYYFILLIIINEVCFRRVSFGDIFETL